MKKRTYDLYLNDNILKEKLSVKFKDKLFYQVASYNPNIQYSQKEYLM